MLGISDKPGGTMEKFPSIAMLWGEAFGSVNIESFLFN